jgi:hypothetical protein
MVIDEQLPAGPQPLHYLRQERRQPLARGVHHRPTVRSALTTSSPYTGWRGPRRGRGIAGGGATDSRDALRA